MPFPAQSTTQSHRLWCLIVCKELWGPSLTFEWWWSLPSNDYTKMSLARVSRNLVEFLELTECDIFILIPEIKVFLKGLMLVESHSIASLASLIIWWWENMLAILTFWMACAWNVEWVPGELASLIVGMTMEWSHHQTKVEISRMWT